MTELFVVFKVDGAEYAVPAAQVLQLESFTGATPVPGAPRHVIGVVQVRGKVVPVVDLRILFGAAPCEPSLDSRIVVCDVRSRTVAILVDFGREVLRLDPEKIAPAPDMLGEQTAGFVRGVAASGGRLIMLVDLSRVVGEEQSNDESARILDERNARIRALPG
jgi:purine-binding chemotaxis protein CheW